MESGTLLITQKDRDRLVALRKARKRLITQREAAAEIGQSERHVRRPLVKLKKEGDHAVMHKLRGRQSNRRAEAKVKKAALELLGQDLYRGFGPTLASEYLGKKHGINVSCETVRSWMIEAKLWRARKQRIEKIHEWRPAPTAAWICLTLTCFNLIDPSATGAAFRKQR